MKRSWPRRAGRLVVFGAFAYYGVLLVLLSLETQLIFRPATAAELWSPPTDERIRELTLRSADGNAVHAWWLPTEGAKGAVLYSHGNAGNLSTRGPSLPKWGQLLDSSVLIYDYPGYGRSTGRPSEPGCVAAAEAAWDWLTTEGGVEPKRVTLLGISLGGSLAIDLARRRDHRALVLVKTFTSIPDMAQVRFPWLPARYFVRTRFDNLSKIRDCRRPVFVFHSRGDELIPFDQGRRLYEAAHEPKELLAEDGGGHNSALPAEFFVRLRAFLDEHAPFE